MKSISPIVGTILIIVMTVAIAGIFYAFTSGMFNSIISSSNNLVNQQSKIISFTINNVYCSNNILYFDIYNKGNIPININNSQIIFTDNYGNTIPVNGSNIICNNGNIIPSGSNSLCYVNNYPCYYNYKDYIKSMNFIYNGISYNYDILNNNKFNLPPFSPYFFQPTNPTISNNNSQGYLAQMPQCNISNNPYGGANGTYGLLNCIAINYGEISAVVWFYLPPDGQGGLFGITTNQYPNPAATLPILYVYNGYLHGLAPSVPISPGWHIVVFESWASSTSGPFYFSIYLDGQLEGTTSASSSAFYNYSSTFPYSDIGATYNYFSSVAQWFFFNGIIAYVAVYNTVLSQSQVQQLYSAGFPNTLFSQNLVVAYLLVNNTAIYQGPPPSYVGSWSNYYFVPWFVNYALLSQMGITNPQAITITPSDSRGLIPETQFLGPIPNNLFSWCRLLQGVNVSVPGSVYVNRSFNVNVQLTTIAQMQYELPYWFLVSINGINESQVLSIDAWVFSSDAINGYVFANNSSLTAPPKPGNYTVVVSLPVCNMMWTEQIAVDPPPSNASTTDGNGSNSTSPPPTNSTSTQPGPGTSSSTSSTSSTTTATSTSSTSLSVLIDALNVVVVVLIVAVAYILYRRRETVVKL